MISTGFRMHACKGMAKPLHANLQLKAKHIAEEMQDALEPCLLSNNNFLIQARTKPQFTHWGYSVDVAASLPELLH